MMAQIDFGSIVAFVLLVAVCLLGLRGGKAGPGAEREIMREHSRLKGRIQKLEDGLKGCATKADIAALSGTIERLEESAASAGGLIALEGKINTLAAEIEGVEGKVDMALGGIKRIEGYFLEKAIKGGGA